MTNNPYASPQSELEQPLPPDSTGGSLDSGINGQYDFEIMAVLKEAWEKTNGVKAAVWGAFIIFIIVSIAISIALAFTLQILAVPEASIIGALISQAIIMLLIYPFLAGMMMIGIYRSVNLPVNASMIFGYFDKMIPIFMAMLLMTILITIGFILLVLPGIYLSVAYILTIPLIVEKNLGAWQALEASRKGITHHWFKIFGLYILMMILYMISAIPFGLGLIWTIPMFITLNGILYRIIYGVEASH